jgi:hypothetical protein
MISRVARRSSIVTKNHQGAALARWASAAIVTAGICLTGGCNSIADSGHRPFLPLGGIGSRLGDTNKDEALRKKVMADKFPTAQEAGI